jgi:hypothetical protein
MDITPTPHGAHIDVTDTAHQLIDLIADVFADRETFMADLLVELAGARSALRSLKADAGTAGTHVEDCQIEAAAARVDGIRDAIVEALDPAERIRIVLTGHGCIRYGQRLVEAGEEACARWQGPVRFPRQQDRSAA